MSTTNVKTLLLLSSETNSSFSFLFHCARCWAQQGSRVLFISKTPVRCLPFSVGSINSPLNPDAFKLVQFMYLTNWQELLQELYSIHLRHNPVSVIIIKNLESYFEGNKGNKDHDITSLVCASLLNAASICAKLTSQPAVVINDYVSQNLTIEKDIIKHFFCNVWQIKTKNKQNATVELSKLSIIADDNVVQFTFNENFDKSMLIFNQVMKKVGPSLLP